MKPFFSIVIPAYNVQNHIENCLSSIVAQGFESYEVLVVDDGSKDKTYSICLEFEKAHSTIKVFSQSNGGPGRAREFGFSHASGEYVFFADADDYLTPDALEHLFQMLSDTGADILEFGYNEISEDGKTNSVHKMHPQRSEGKDCLIHYLTRKNATSYLFNKVFRSNLFESITFTHYYAGEDGCVNMQLYSNADIVVNVSDIFYNHVIHKSSLVHQKFNSYRADHLKSDKFMYDYLQNNYPELCFYMLPQICSHCAVIYCESHKSTLKDKGEIMEKTLCAFNEFYPEIDEKTIKLCSAKRRLLIKLFNFSPKLCAFIYLIVK